jgi:hypothetical protein
MAFEYVDSMHKISLAATADLSAKQYHVVKVATGGTTFAAAVTDIPLGILQNAPTSGKTAEVAISGVSKAVASAAISAGALVGITVTTGRVKAIVAGTDTTQYVLGQALTAAGAAGDVITVLFDCKSPTRAN